METSKYLESKGIRFHMFFEPDNDMGYSSITTEPLEKEQCKAMSNFKLWRAQ
ncbi:MAG: hypothetical protein ACYDD5_00400 [Sulfuricurvum sp.]